jgi:hypothetical protein
MRRISNNTYVVRTYPKRTRRSDWVLGLRVFVCLLLMGLLEGLTAIPN